MRRSDFREKLELHDITFNIIQTLTPNNNQKIEDQVDRFIGFCLKFETINAFVVTNLINWNNSRIEDNLENHQEINL